MSDQKKEVKKEPWKKKGLHLVRFHGEDRCGRCCLCLEEAECRRFSPYCAEGYYIRTAGWVQTYKDIDIY